MRVAKANENELVHAERGGTPIPSGRNIPLFSQ